MAKTAKPRRDPATNPRSRTARRATSPGIDVDRSIRDAPRASDATPVLGAVRNGGISKKQKKKQLTHGQRARQEKGLARAEAVMDRTIKKIDLSKKRSKNIQQRAGRWEDVNGAAIEEIRKSTHIPEPGKTAETEWEDVNEENEEDTEMKATNTLPESKVSTTNTTDETTTAAVQDDEIDLIT